MRLFEAVGTQWRLAPMGEAVGLDYAALAATAAMMGIAMNPDRLDQIQIMERAVLREIHKRRQIDAARTGAQRQARRR